MATIWGPNIVTDELSLYLDAANVESYAPAGTIPPKSESIAPAWDKSGYTASATTAVGDDGVILHDNDYDNFVGRFAFTPAAGTYTVIFEHQASGADTLCDINDDGAFEDSFTTTFTSTTTKQIHTETNTTSNNWASYLYLRRTAAGGSEVTISNFRFYKSDSAGNSLKWYDLSGNGIVFGTQGTTMTPFQTVSGSPALTFNDSGYWESEGGASQSDKVDIGGDCTIILWVYSDDLTERDTIFEKAGNTYASYQQEIAITWEPNEYFTYYSRDNTYDYASTGYITVDKWNMAAIKMSTGRTTVARTGAYSINGANWNWDSYTSRSDTALVSAGNITVGYGYANVVTNGSIGSVLCYNKMLSDTEILQNFNAHKGRFGL